MVYLFFTIVMNKSVLHVGMARKKNATPINILAVRGGYYVNTGNSAEINYSASISTYRSFTMVALANKTANSTEPT